MHQKFPIQALPKRVFIVHQLNGLFQEQPKQQYRQLRWNGTHRAIWDINLNYVGAQYLSISHYPIFFKLVFKF